MAQHGIEHEVVALLGVTDVLPGTQPHVHPAIVDHGEATVRGTGKEGKQGDRVDRIARVALDETPQDRQRCRPRSLHQVAVCYGQDVPLVKAPRGIVGKLLGEHRGRPAGVMHLEDPLELGHPSRGIPVAVQEGEPLRRSVTKGTRDDKPQPAVIGPLIIKSSLSSHLTEPFAPAARGGCLSGHQPKKP